MKLSIPLALLASVLNMSAETGYEAWLRYAPITDPAIRQRYESLPAVVVVNGDSPILRLHGRSCCAACAAA